jgi:hypothetical protein
MNNRIGKYVEGTGCGLKGTVSAFTWEDTKIKKKLPSG